MEVRDFYNKLIASNIINSTGKVTITLHDVDVTINELDAIGHLIQEWVYGWALKHNVKIERNPHTQQFPDYYLDGLHSDKGFMEIKTFNFNASPAFDVADFFEYVDFLKEMPYKLYADYLVIGYKMSPEGNLMIKDVWLKKIWEIVGYSSKNNITCQIRESKGVRRPYKIRPTNFHRGGRTFASPKYFLQELQMLLNSNSITQGNYNTWFEDVNKAHYKHYNKNIE